MPTGQSPEQPGVRVKLRQCFGHLLQRQQQQRDNLQGNRGMPGAWDNARTSSST